MKNNLRATLAATIFVAVPLAGSQAAEEGALSFNTVFAGAAVSLPMGKERLQINYEGTGLSLAASGEGLSHYSSMWCVGSLHAVQGKFEDDSGMCRITYPDGDKAFTVYQAAGILGKPVKGTWTYVGGTGKYEGISGGGEFTRIGARPAKDGTFQSNNITTGTYKLP